MEQYDFLDTIQCDTNRQPLSERDKHSTYDTTINDRRNRLRKDNVFDKAHERLTKLIQTSMLPHFHQQRVIDLLEWEVSYTISLDDEADRTYKRMTEDAMHETWLPLRCSGMQHYGHEQYRHHVCMNMQHHDEFRSFWENINAETFEIEIKKKPTAFMERLLYHVLTTQDKLFLVVDMDSVVHIIADTQMRDKKLHGVIIPLWHELWSFIRFDLWDNLYELSQKLPYKDYADSSKTMIDAIYNDLQDASRYVESYEATISVQNKRPKNMTIAFKNTNKNKYAQLKNNFVNGEWYVAMDESFGKIVRIVGEKKYHYNKYLRDDDY